MCSTFEMCRVELRYLKWLLSGRTAQLFRYLGRDFFGFLFCFFPRPGRGVDHSPLSSAEVKERVALYLYSPLWVFMAFSRVNLIFFFLPFTFYFLQRCE